MRHLRMGTQSAKGADARKKYSEELKRGMVDRFVGQAKRPAEPSDDETREIGRLKEERGGSGGRKRGAADLARRHFTGHIVHFVEHYYNLLRLHSALQYRTPNEFECAAAVATPPQPYLRATLSFPRYKEIYPDA